LHANANSEERLPFFAHGLIKRIDHSRNFVESAPTVGEGADTRKNDTLSSRNGIGVAGHHNWLAPTTFARRPLECLGS
jgi:hypothetical protein